MLTFDQAVERIKVLEDALQHQEATTAFEQGDIALALAPLGDDGAHNGSQGTLERLAEATGVPLGTLRDRRLVAARVPPTERSVGVPWSAYQIIANLGNGALRARMLAALQHEAPPAPHQRWSVNAVRQAIGRPPTNGTADITEASPERKAEVFAQLAADPDIRQAVAPIGGPAALALNDLVRDQARRREERVERLVQADPISRGFDQMGAKLELESLCAQLARTLVQFRSEFDALLLRVGDLDEANLFWINGSIDTIEATLQHIRARVHPGTTDLDAFLERELGGHHA
jgi:hypothetical protein